MICISVYTQPHLVGREEREYTQYKRQVHCYTSLHSETHALILTASSSCQSCDLHLANHFSESLELLLDGKLSSVPRELVQVIGWGDCNQTQREVYINILAILDSQLSLLKCKSSSEQPALRLMLHALLIMCCCCVLLQYFALLRCL